TRGSRCACGDPVPPEGSDPRLLLRPASTWSDRPERSSRSCRGPGHASGPRPTRSHARADQVDRDPVRPWHDPSDLTYVDFVRSAMYQFDISARHLVGHPTTW